MTTWYDLAVLSEENDGVVELTPGYSTQAFSPQMAQSLFTDLVDTVNIIRNAGIDWARQSALHGTEIMPRSSSALAHQPPAVNGSGTHGQGGKTNGTSMDRQVPDTEPAASLERIWFSVFTSKRAGVAAREMHHVPFYQLGGDLLSSAHLVALVEEGRRKTAQEQTVHGKDTADVCPEVTIDDVLRCPSLTGFARLVHQRRIELD